MNIDQSERAHPLHRIYLCNELYDRDRFHDQCIDRYEDSKLHMEESDVTREIEISLLSLMSLIHLS